jgi:flagellar FliL protein
MFGNDKLDKIFMLLSMFMTLTAVSMYVYTNIIFERKKVIEEEEFIKFKEESKEAEVLENIHLKKIVINLQSKSQRLRYVEFDAHLIPFKKEKLEFLNGNTAIIQDQFIDIASKFEAEELNSVLGKILFENRVKKGINQKFGSPIIKKIFFSRFVIQ